MTTSTQINETSLNDMTGSQLVALYNDMTNSDIKKFTDKKTAIGRIIKAQNELMQKTDLTHHTLIDDVGVITPKTQNVVETVDSIEETLITETQTSSHGHETYNQQTQTLQNVEEQNIEENSTTNVLAEEKHDSSEKVQPKKRGRKPNVNGVPVPKQEKKPRGVSKEMRLVHLFTSNPGKPIPLDFAKMVCEGLPNIEDVQFIKTSSFNCILAYIRSAISGFGMRIEKEGKNLVYVPQRNTQNWHTRRGHIKGLLDIVHDAIESGNYTPYELPTV